MNQAGERSPGLLGSPRPEGRGSERRGADRGGTRERPGSLDHHHTAPGTDPSTTSVTDRLAWVALSRLVEPGHLGVAELVDPAGPAALLERVVSGDPLPLCRTLRARLAGVDPWRRAESDIERVGRVGGRVLTRADPEWPTAAFAALRPLAEAEHAHITEPLCLWVRGPVGVAEAAQRAVGVVGARAATGYGTHVAGELGYGLAERGWAVVSGGAFGIDGAAHRGALAAGGVTIAVLAGGVDVPYPLAHASLLDRISDEGLLISEIPPGESPQRRRFLQRNRLIAALSAGLVVVEAGRRSGTSVTAERAHQLGRPLMAVPGPVTSALSVGTHGLIRDCGAVLVTSAAEVTEEVGPIGAGLEEVNQDVSGATVPDAAEGRLDRDALPAELLRVLEAVPAGRPASVEAVALAARVSPTTVRRALPALVLRGFVDEASGGYRLSAAARAVP